MWKIFKLWDRSKSTNSAIQKEPLVVQLGDKATSRKKKIELQIENAFRIMDKINVMVETNKIKKDLFNQYVLEFQDEQKYKTIDLYWILANATDDDLNNRFNYIVAVYYEVLWRNDRSESKIP